MHKDNVGKQFLHLYRGISGNDDDVDFPHPLDSNYVGVHWTSDPAVARNFATKGTHGYIISAQVDPRHVKPYDEYDLDFALRGVYPPTHWEKEITLHPLSTIRITKVTKLEKVKKNKYEEVDRWTGDVTRDT